MKTEKITTGCTLNKLALIVSLLGVLFPELCLGFASVWVREPYIYRPSVQFTVRMVANTGSWKDANDMCKESDEELAVVLSPFENTALQTLISGFVDNSSEVMQGAWIGMRLSELNTNNEWDNGCAPIFTQWHHNRNRAKKRGCVYISRSGLWRIKECKDRLISAICQKRQPDSCPKSIGDKSRTCPDNFGYKCNDQCYYWGGLQNHGQSLNPNASPLSFEMAAEKCASLNSSLVNIRNLEENNCLRERVNVLLSWNPREAPWRNTNGFWIGHNRLQINQSESISDFTNFPSGFVPGNGTCDQIGWMGLWTDNLTCEEPHAYICQTDALLPPTEIDPSLFPIAVCIVTFAGINLVIFLCIVSYVCSRKHPGKSATSMPMYRHDDCDE